jgi:hypothetical protein
MMTTMIQTGQILFGGARRATGIVIVISSVVAFARL